MQNNETETQEVWLLKVHHPETTELKKGWADVGVFKSPQLAKKAVETLSKAGRIANDENGNSFEIKRFDVRG